MTAFPMIDIYKQTKLDYDIDEVIKENLEIENEFVKEVVYGVNTYAKDLEIEVSSRVQFGVRNLTFQKNPIEMDIGLEFSF